MNLPFTSGLLKGVLFLNFFIYSVNSFGQITHYYPYYNSDTMPNYNLAIERKNAVLNNIILENPSGNISKKDFESEKKDIANYIFSEVRNYAFLDTVIESYVRNVFNKVKKQFSVGDKCNIVVVRSPMVNAMSIGDGTIFIYTGLFSVLENEDQLAYIIAHELSHIELKHTTSALMAYLDKKETNELRKEIKRTLKEKYEINKKLYSLLLKSTLSYTFNSRKDELQTDSLAFIKFRNTEYNAHQAPKALLVFDKDLKVEGRSLIELENHFNCQGHQYNFKKEPVVVRSIFNVEDEDNIFSSTDTLLTHPDPGKRAKIIEDLLNSNKVPDNETKINDRFLYVKEAAKIQDMQAYFRNEYYDLTLFNALLMLEKYPESSYLKSIIVLSLYQMKKYMKKHEFSQVVLKLSKKNPDNFNHLLDMLFSLRLQDFTQFANCFKEKLPEQREKNEYSFAVQYALAELNDDKVTAIRVMEEYDKIYPEGVLSFIFEKPNDDKNKKKK